MKSHPKHHWSVIFTQNKQSTLEVGEGNLFQVRPELEGLTNDQLKTLAEAALDIFTGA